MSDLARLYRASAHSLPMVETGSVQSVITSPPYFGLRKYDGEQDIEWPTVTYAPIAGMAAITVQGCEADCEHIWSQNVTNLLKPIPPNVCILCGGWRGPLGNEPTIEAYIAHLILCAREWRRCLHDTGTLFVNLGDSYANNPSTTVIPRAEQGNGRGLFQIPPEKHNQVRRQTPNRLTDIGLPKKNLLMVPARFALAMQADGWILRSEMIWAKPNPMPESVTDRPTKAHEMIYLFSKQERYFWDADAVREPYSAGSLSRYAYEFNPDTPSVQATKNPAVGGGKIDPNPLGRNMRSVLNIPTQSYAAAHFAVWPVALVEPMIKAGSRAGDTVLDPFSGSGTTGRVAVALGRRYIGIDLAAEYLDTLAPERLTVQMEMM